LEIPVFQTEMNAKSFELGVDRFWFL